MSKPFGLTGGIGCGKTTVSQFFSEAGFQVIDSDIVAHEVVKKGQPAWQQIHDAFGSEYFLSDGSLNRKKLAELVFSNATQLNQLNSIVHPIIQETCRNQATELLSKGYSVLIVVPLLFELNLEKEFQQTISVGCSPQTQQVRLLERGWTLQEIQARCAAQLTVEEKNLRADLVIWNDGTLEILKSQTRRAIDQWKEAGWL